MRSLAAALAALIALAATFPGPARASQYPLDQAAAIIPRDDAPRLRKAGIRTTEDFLVWGRTAEGRRLLAERCRLALDRIEAWVNLADLMRVRGIGPDVARLLTAVGVRTLFDLQRADGDATAASVRDFNKRTHLSTNPPGAPSIKYWIEMSRALPVIVSRD